MMCLSTGHVPEDDRGGAGRAHGRGERPEGGDQAALHAVAGRHQQLRQPRLQGGGREGTTCTTTLLFFLFRGLFLFTL